MVRISSAFDGGNIEVVSTQSVSDIQLKIPKDNQSDFFQWFYFRLSGAQGETTTLRLLNASESSYPDGWVDYQAVASYDRQTWFRVPTTYDGKVLSISVTPERDGLYIAYFAPYSMERHQDLVGKMGNVSFVEHHVLGSTLDGRDMDMLQVGTPGADKKSIWIIGRQHPGETMAEWWMEGFLNKLTDSEDPTSRELIQSSVFYVVPNMNPDGSFRGHLRTNAIGKNLNREWADTTPETSPEVYWVLEKMKATGLDFCLDVHGDEALPYNFIAGAEGIPSWTEACQKKLDRFKEILEQQSSDFQTKVGYPLSPPGEGNMTLCTNAIAERFQALAMTLEMPFKDTVETPNPQLGWSPNRCGKLGEACLEAIRILYKAL